MKSISANFIMYTSGDGEIHVAKGSTLTGSCQGTGKRSALELCALHMYNCSELRDFMYAEFYVDQAWVR